MLSFHGDPKLKEAAITRMRQHREQERLVPGIYWRPVGVATEEALAVVGLTGPSDGYVGCAVGCLVAEAVGYGTRTPRLAADLYLGFETCFGIPADLARIEESVFEWSSSFADEDPGAPPLQRILAWPEEFLSAIPVGVDLTTYDWRALHDKAALAGGEDFDLRVAALAVLATFSTEDGSVVAPIPTVVA